MTPEKICKDLSLSYTFEMDSQKSYIQHEMLSPETIIKILEKRWQMNGVQKLKKLFKQYRLQAIKEQDNDQYRQIWIEFNNALTARIDENLKTLLSELGISEEDFKQVYDRFFPDKHDRLAIENQSHWKTQTLPAHLTPELFQRIHGECLELQNILAKQESARLDQKLDLDNDEDRYICQMAVDIKTREYDITEEQF